MISQQLLLAIGLSFVFLGILTIIVGILVEILRGTNKRKEHRQEEKSKTEYGGVIFIGPIPIVFGSNKDMAKLALIIGVIMFVFIVLIIILSTIM
ncbi:MULTISPECIES: TIGR00304 family membrane protein [unclassified Stygiolobus]|uniref:TIGR00304 family membrane protein n=1 Tax=unclassified Stygiolobus TaxID=2824672 RepID=UPI00307D602D